MAEEVSMKSRIMYIEFKGSDVTGPGRIGRVTFSHSGKTLYYKEKKFKSQAGYAGANQGKENYFDVETGDGYWISGCKKRGGDRLYPGTIEIDDDAREEYWTEIRKMPENKNRKLIRCKGKYGGKHCGSGN
jgi:hypothetical protein